jgi:hypothetical protein
MGRLGAVFNKSLVDIVVGTLGEKFETETFANGIKVDRRVSNHRGKKTKYQDQRNNLDNDSSRFFVIPQSRDCVSLG